MKNLALRENQQPDRPNVLAKGKKRPMGEGIIKRTAYVDGTVEVKGRETTITGEVHGDVKVHPQGKLEIISELRVSSEISGSDVLCDITPKTSLVINAKGNLIASGHLEDVKEKRAKKDEVVTIRGKEYGGAGKEPEDRTACEINAGQKLTIVGELHGQIHMEPEAHYILRRRGIVVDKLV